jgi:hypothetical protein
LKIIKRIIMVLVIMIFAYSILPWFVFPVLNDIKANNLGRQLRNEPLPQYTTIVEVQSGSGNTGGTGDHTEVWAGILISTKLSEEKIIQFYGKNVYKVDGTHKKTAIMELLDKDFSNLQSVSDYEGFYIVERVRKAVSSFFDLRGA